jgi:phenylpyruvate tautomerase PptA (4-oxalocrotonate tautomerase family)
VVVEAVTEVLAVVVEDITEVVAVVVEDVTGEGAGSWRVLRRF